MIQPDEKVCTGINRLNVIIQKLTQLGQPPSDSLTLAKFKEALEISSLNQLWLTILLKAELIYAEIVTTCKRYAKAMEQQRASFIVGEAHTVLKKAVVCSYHKCSKKGHSVAHCWIKKQDQEMAQLKASGKGQRPLEDSERIT